MSARPVPLSAKYKGSFAYDTVKERLPVILTKIIDRVHRCIRLSRESIGEVAADDIKNAVSELSKLRNEMMTDKPLSKMVDLEGDVEKWNTALENLKKEEGDSPSHFKSPWLFVECAMYRKIYSILQTSKYTKNFDPFQSQKDEAFKKSLPGATIMADYLQNCTNQEIDSHSMEIYFKTFLKASLWSNRFDLSLSAGVNHDPGSHDPVAVMHELQDYILADDTDKIFKCLLDAQNSNDVRVDIVLDNAGFEFLSDLFLAEFLLQSKLANRIHFHVKNFPWFVSDVTAQDVWDTLIKLAASDIHDLSIYGQKWESRFGDDSFTLVPKELCEYWTLPMPYKDLLHQDKMLYDYLKGADLIIFKGDLNFRKLVGDLSWCDTTPFGQALESFHPAPLCVLRTLKADVVVGLEPGKAAEAELKDKNWMVSGKYGVILFHS